MNTEFTYLYRDASNYKVGKTIVLPGTLTDAQKSAICAKLDQEEYFIPSQVGLPDLQRYWRDVYGLPVPNDDHHVWHEIVAIEETDDVPTVILTALELYEAFERVQAWDEQGAMERLQLLAGSLS